MSKLFNEKEAFEKEIKPLTEQLFDACKKHNLPYLSCICFSREVDSFTTAFGMFTPDEGCPASFNLARLVLDPDPEKCEDETTD